jgi:hypothetical protein
MISRIGVFVPRLVTLASLAPEQMHRFEPLLAGKSTHRVPFQTNSELYFDHSWREMREVFGLLSDDFVGRSSRNPYPSYGELNARSL